MLEMYSFAQTFYSESWALHVLFSPGGLDKKYDRFKISTTAEAPAGTHSISVCPFQIYVDPHDMITFESIGFKSGNARHVTITRYRCLDVSTI